MTSLVKGILTACNMIPQSAIIATVVRLRSICGDLNLPCRPAGCSSNGGEGPLCAVISGGLTRRDLSRCCCKRVEGVEAVQNSKKVVGRVLAPPTKSFVPETLAVGVTKVTSRSQLHVLNNSSRVPTILFCSHDFLKPSTSTPASSLHYTTTP